MLIGLHDAEYERMPKKTFPNLALMKISAYHKARGDTVEWWSASKSDYDLVYSSKVFDFTPVNPYLPPNTIKGGTGYGLYDELPPDIDAMFPDYGIYSKCDFAIGYLTRGCVRKCDFCIVPVNEGQLRPYGTWQEIVRADTDKLILMDNNILASEYGIKQLAELAETDYRLDINQGMDVRLLTDEICVILKRIKWLKYIRFSCDHAEQLPFFEKLAALFDRHGIAKSKVFIYLLVRKNLLEADYRVQELHRICKSFSLYAQAERNSAKGITASTRQLDFTHRYVYGRLYKRETWTEYCKRHKLDMKD